MITNNCIQQFSTRNKNNFDYSGQNVNLQNHISSVDWQRCINVTLGCFELNTSKFTEKIGEFFGKSA